MSMTFFMGRWAMPETDGGQNKICVAARGSKHMHMVVFGNPIHAIKQPLTEERYVRVVMRTAQQEYALQRAAEFMLKIGAEKGITQRAKALLLGAQQAGAKSESTMNEEELEKMENENPMADGAADPNTPAGAVTESMAEKKENEMRAKSKAAKAAKKTTAKAAPKQAEKAPTKVKASGKKVVPKAAKKKASAAAKPKGERKAKEKGPGGFRAGTKKAAAFVWFKEQMAKYGEGELDRGIRKSICEKMAAKFELSASTPNSWFQIFSKVKGA